MVNVGSIGLVYFYLRYMNGLKFMVNVGKIYTIYMEHLGLLKSTSLFREALSI